jgi:hypothetical protein
LKIGPFFLQHFKNKIIYNFVKFMPTKKGSKLIFSPLSFVAVSGSGTWIQDGKNHDPGSGINILDLQH